MSEPLRLYWARCGWRCRNAGDEISVDIVAALSGRPIHDCVPENAQLVACGSLAQDLPPQFHGAVWGTGLLFGDRFVATPMAQVHAVRGRLTAAHWQGCARDDMVYGDPGLLAVKVLYPSGMPPVEKRYLVGVVPHYVDGDNAALYEWCQSHRETVTTIDICARPRDVLEAMARCRFILSSSLHGLVFADALGIPNEWIHLSDKLAGGDFKFYDYLTAFNMRAAWLPFHNKLVPEQLVEERTPMYVRPGLADIQRRLLEAFPFPRVNP